MRSIVRLLLATSLLTVGLVAATGPVAAQLTITVTPDTGVIDGQTVTVQGTGFTPGLAAGAAQCSSAVLDSESPSDCDGSTITTGTVAGDGSVEINLVARRIINASNQTIDCAAQDACVVVLVAGTNIDNLVDTVAAPIQFEGTPLPPFEVTAEIVTATPQALTAAVSCNQPIGGPVTVKLQGTIVQERPGVDPGAWPRSFGVTTIDCPASTEIVIPLVPHQRKPEGKLRYPYRRLISGPAQVTLRAFAGASPIVDTQQIALTDPTLTSRQSFDRDGVEVRVKGVQVNPGGRAVANIEARCDSQQILAVEIQALRPSRIDIYRTASATQRISCGPELQTIPVDLNNTVHPQRDDLVPAGRVEIYATATSNSATRSVDMRPVTTSRKMHPRSIRIRHHPQARITIQDATTEGVTASFRCKRDAIFSVFTTLGQPVAGVVFNDRGWDTMTCEADQTVEFTVAWKGAEIRPDVRSAVVVRAINGRHGPNWTHKFQQNQAVWRVIT